MVVAIGQRQNQTFDKLDRKLARVLGLLDVIILHVRENPYVAGILAERVSGKLPDLGSLEVLLVGIFGWDPDRVQIECVVLGLGEPQDRFVSAR